MLVFSPKRFSALSYRADFIRHPYANISFFDADRVRILFHLSLRRAEGLAVCNRRGADQETWQQEITQQVALAPDNNRVELRFESPRVTVYLNGQKIFHFGPRFGRPRFPELGQISFVDFQGGIPAGTIDMEHTVPAGTTMALSPRLELRGRLDHSYQPDALRFEIEGVVPPPALIVSPSGTGSSLRSILPGRIWQGLGPDEPLSLRLFDGENLISKQALTRQELLSQMQAALATDGLGSDPVLATQLIEHARFSGVSGDLNPGQQSRLAQLARQLGLDPFLDLPTLPTARPDPTAPDERALQEALAAVTAALRGMDNPADLPRILDALPQPPASLRHIFYIALAEPFCQRDAFDPLYAHAQPHLTAGEVQVGDNAWMQSGLLPYLLRDGRIDLLLRILRKLVGATERWLMTPPLAWTIRAALTDPALTDKMRTDVILIFLAFLNRRVAEYWQRTPCTQLTETTVALIAAGPRLNRKLRNRIEATALRCYGLSPDFWQRIDTEAEPLPPQLAAAQQAFAALTDPAATPDAQATALALFERARNPECARIRRDLFGPAGLPGPEAPTLPALMAAGMDAEDAALRHMAAPDSSIDSVPVDAQVQDLVRASLPDLPKLVTRAPRYRLQSRASRHALAVLQRARSGADPHKDCSALLPDLDALTDVRDHWIGPGLALALLTGLLEAGAVQASDGLASWLKQALNRAISAQPNPLVPAEEPALAQPLTRLRQQAAPVPETTRDIAEMLGQAGPVSPAPPPLLSGWVNPLFDTVVVVVSCRAHLETRIPQLRAGWVSRLAALGVPYLIVTGDGDGSIEEDILHLDAPDDYEGLPQKSLAAIRWVHDNTSFAHTLKIDDDCFLNPEEYFHSLSFRKFDYYGRTLTREAGQMDRAWHCAKSSSERGRLEFDKSPEPSSYCDGGSGYALSRRAMTTLLEAVASATGQALIQVSFMEDKLVGDLLALGGIAPANEDYHISIRRRAHPGGIAVSRWLNGFDASRTAPVKLVHLDESAAQAEANRRLDEPGLFPKKIWPSYQQAALGEHSNALDMVTPLTRLSAARDAPVAVVAAMRNEMFMLPHFLAHYRALGVESFLIADNCSNDGTLEYLAEQPDVALFSTDTDYRRAQYGVAWQQALISRFRTGRWSLIADADELLTWQLPQQQSLPDLLRSDAFQEVDAARVFMLDMYPKGDLDMATFASGDPFAEAGFTDRDPFLRRSFARGPYSNAPTWTSAVRHRLIPGSRNELFVAQKIALLKYSPFQRLSAGLHYVAGARLASRELLFGHFKYNADFRRKAQAEVARRQHFNNAEEYRKYLAMTSEGRARIYDPELSVSWTESDFVKALML